MWWVEDGFGLHGGLALMVLGGQGDVAVAGFQAPEPQGLPVVGGAYGSEPERPHGSLGCVAAAQLGQGDGLEGTVDDKAWVALDVSQYGRS